MTHPSDRYCGTQVHVTSFSFPFKIQTTASEQNTGKRVTQSAVEVKVKRQGEAQSLAIFSSQAVNRYLMVLCVVLQLVALKTKIC